ncbi:MAG TPA: hypothetical protein DCX77_05945 [Acidimicrobiaceae bacterium]|nr:hypothetical protein [Acidimicrobiaceae bacterium]
MSTIIDLGKLRFQFRDAYVNTTQYEYNDVVIYGGDVFVYINVTSGTGNIPTNTTYWSKMVSGLNSTGAWSSATTYQNNDLVTHGGSLYRATAPSTNEEPPNTSYWAVVAGGLTFRGDWATATVYLKDDHVVHQGSAYRALSKHTSAGTFLADLSGGKWERYAQGTQNRSVYATSTDYFKGDLVQTGTAPNLDHFICTADHTSDASADPGTSPESANWTRLIAGTYTSSNQDRQYAFFVGY